MRTLPTLVAAAAALTLAAALAPAAALPAMPMNGAQETQEADPDGHGFFTYSLDGTEFCWTVTWKRIQEPFAGHIHVGDRGVAGPIVIPLDGDGDGQSPDPEGCATISGDLAAAIAADPEGYYVNLHNETYPAGAIRGQLKTQRR